MKVCYSFQAEIYAILHCAHEIQLHGRPENHVSIQSDSQAALKALQAARTSLLAHHWSNSVKRR
jgi:hypothetical protein